jgi:hypothetical protein
MGSIEIPSFEDGGLYVNKLLPNWDGWRNFRVGTCTGLWRDAEGAYEILSIINRNPGNKHVEAVFWHFYQSCKRDKRNFIIREVMNPGLAAKLIKLGFTLKTESDYIKHYKDI